jgi:hypothetical protein
VSNAGGEQPLWSRDGRELFYVQRSSGANEGQLMAVTLDTAAPGFSYGARTKVLDWPYVFPFDGRTYDVAPDGQRFLTVKPYRAEGEEATRPQVIIVENWAEELKRLVPVE